jgi:hypothetical protein
MSEPGYASNQRKNTVHVQNRFAGVKCAILPCFSANYHSKNAEKLPVFVIRLAKSTRYQPLKCSKKGILPEMTKRLKNSHLQDMFIPFYPVVMNSGVNSFIVNQ